jgi:glycerol-3-phosphate dehydrogenase
VVFTIPYERDFTLVGTTDIPYDGDPATVAPSDEEAAYLCGLLGDYFTRRVDPATAAWSYAGVRPLADSGQVNASAVTRDYAFDLDAPEGAAPVLSVFGGKLTTFRKLAEHALRDLGRALRDPRPAWTAGAKLPGGDLPGGDFARFVAETAAAHPWLREPTLTRLCRAYGTRLPMLLGDAKSWADMGHDFGAGLTEREAEHLRADEWAVTGEDVLWRRSKLGLHMTEFQRLAFSGWFNA